MGTIVTTGGTSGFGAIAVDRLRPGGDRLLLGARAPAADPGILELDLASLASVRTFAARVRDRLAGEGIDALVLNAGVVRRDDEARTVDGFETTFAVNHLAHHLLLRLLLPALAEGAGVVLTTSGTHDPALHTGLVPPRHAEAALLAHPERDPGRPTSGKEAGQHAYTASKLCVVLLGRALCQQPEARARRLRVVAFDPGQVFGTGLARDLPLPMRAAWRLLSTPALGRPMRRLSATLNSPAAAGDALAGLVSGREHDPGGAPGPAYAALRRGRLTWCEPSVLARRDDLARSLWTESEVLAGSSV